MMLRAFNPVHRTWRRDMGMAALFAFGVMAAMLALQWSAIQVLGFRDGDDALRLVQVRDLLAGQGWFDVSQHRINPPTGGLMHWSRLIDVQIAGLILLLRPFLGSALAEQWAVALYPPLLLFPLFAMIALVLRRLSDDRPIVMTGLLLAATSVSFLHYFVPLRIDHHGWQVILSTAMLAIALGAVDARRGLLGGLVMSLHLAISLEALPYILIFGGVFALAWLRDAAAGPRLWALVAGLALFAPLLLLATRGFAGVVSPWCDAWSRPYMLATLAAAMLLLAGGAWRGFARDWRYRLALLVAAGGAGGAIFAWQGATCLAGPFGALEPLVRQYWYANVLEGQSLMRQQTGQAALLLVTPLVGLILSVRWWWKLPSGPMRSRWGDMVMILAASVLLSAMVARTSAVAHVFALPALSVTGWTLWRHARALQGAAARITASLSVLLVVPPVLGEIAVRATALVVPPRVDSSTGLAACPARADLAGLAKKPPALVMAAIDIGPMILVHTPHSVIATGHHRNHVAMNRVIGAFAATPAEAKTIIHESRAQWLIVCPQQAEIANIAKGRPNSLAAMLHGGAAPQWLEPEPMPKGSAARLYHVAVDR